MCGNEQFNYETCHPVYPEIGLKIGFLSHKTLRLRGVAESEASEINHAPSVYSVQHYFQALKRVTFYDGFWKSALLRSFEKITYGMAVLSENVLF